MPRETLLWGKPCLDSRGNPSNIFFIVCTMFRIILKKRESELPMSSREGWVVFREWAMCGPGEGETGTSVWLTIFLQKVDPRAPPNPGRRLLSSSGLQQGDELLPRLGGSGLGGLS